MQKLETAGMGKRSLSSVAITISAALAVLFGCSSSSNEPTSVETGASAPEWIELGEGAGIELEGEFVMCGKWESRSDVGAVSSFPEAYSFRRLNEELASDERLRNKTARLGITEVSSCEQARTLTKARAELLATGQAAEALAPADGDTTRPLPAEEFPAGSDGRVDKIGSGVVEAHGPTVQLGIWYGTDFGKCTRCSGTLISPNEILTAAHCVIADNLRPITVRAFDDTCVHGSCATTTDPCTAPKPARNGTTFMYPFYSGLGDWVEDVGIIVMNSDHAAPVNSSSSWMRIVEEHYRLGERYWLRGWGRSSESGAGGNVLRRSKQEIANQSESEHRMLAHAVVHGQGTTCVGDSGGPAITTSYGFEAVVGVASGGEVSNPSSFCPLLGDEFYHAQTWPKISWIESIIGHCNHYETNGLKYAKCWFGT